MHVFEQVKRKPQFKYLTCDVLQQVDRCHQLHSVLLVRDAQVVELGLVHVHEAVQVLVAV